VKRTPLTSNQTLTQNLLVVGVILGGIALMGPLQDLFWDAALDLGPFGSNSAAAVASAAYLVARLLAAVAMIVGCILGLRRTERARTWVRLATACFIARQAGHFIYIIVDASLSSLPSDAPVVAMGAIHFAWAFITTAIPITLFLQTSHPDVAPWLERRPPPPPRRH